MTVHAALDGHPIDLEALARHFLTGNPRIMVTDDGTFLESTALDDVFRDGGRLAEEADELLARLNGYATLADAGYRSVWKRTPSSATANPPSSTSSSTTTPVPATP